MEIKNILGKINQPPEPPEMFFAIEIGYEVVKTAVWTVQNKATQIVSVGSIEEWKGDSVEDLIESIDKSLSVATAEIDSDPNKVIFGLPESWVSNDGLVEQKKNYLKEITKKLDLKAVGFVMTTEAIIHHLKLKEGGLPSVILVYLTETEAVVSIVKNGVLTGTQPVGRSDDLSKDVEEGLARFGQIGDLPSRIIVFDGNIDLEEAKQNLINYDWLASSRFLHFPKIEDLDSHGSVTAIAIAGGAEVARSLGIQVQEEASQELKENEKTEEIETLDPQEFGFSDQRTDGALESQEPQLDHADNFQVVDAIPVNKPSEENHTDQTEFVTQPSVSEPSAPVEKKSSKFSLHLPRLPKLSLFTKSNKDHKLSLPAFVPIGIVVLMLFAVGGVVAYWQIPKVTLEIKLSPKKIEKDIAFTLNPNQEVLDVQNASIPAKAEFQELGGEKEAPTTGTKIVGERAKGKVNIFNLTQSTKTFDAGTKINFDKYTFTLDENVTVASATAEISSDYKTTVTPSQSQVSVTAVDIGDKYNFSKDTELTVGTFAKSSLVAKATSDFKGGFSREIQAVSKEDQQNLKKALVAELTAQAVKNRSSMPSQKQGMVEVAESTIINETYSEEVGSEADSVRIALAFKIPMYTFNLADVGLLVQKNYAADFPADFSIDPQNISIEVTSSEKDEQGMVKVNAKAKLNLSPTINSQDLASKIRGKKPAEVKKFLTEYPNILSAQSQFIPDNPLAKITFPQKIENITINFSLGE